MQGYNLPGFLMINAYQFINIIYALLVLMILLFSFILCFTFYKRKIDRDKKIWQQDIAEMISQAIFQDDEEEESADISTRVKKLLKNLSFRNYMIDELIQTKKNLSGSSNGNIKKLYELLELDKDSFKRLLKPKWHFKARGIQELGVMEQIKYEKDIFKLANNENELVRNEMQCALVSFYGFSGLRFLDVTEYPISQWQQIQLLNNLNQVQPENFDDIKKWLQSSNESVVVFSLKLAALYNCYDVYNNVIDCLQRPGILVKTNALEYLKKMPQDGTSEHFVNHYTAENKSYNLSVIRALKDIGTEQEINFLLKKLHDNDDDIKAAAAKSLSCLHPLGISFLQTYLFADENPWKAIFLQITNERAA
ncbi:MAG: HEAT repeat domain-containing protein [Ginsengibacter sp.]